MTNWAGAVQRPVRNHVCERRRSRRTSGRPVSQLFRPSCGSDHSSCGGKVPSCARVETPDALALNLPLRESEGRTEVDNCQSFV